MSACRYTIRFASATALVLGAAGVAAEMPRPAAAATAPAPPAAVNSWEPCGWGGGGYYFSTVFHPGRDGVIYLGQDTGGVSKSTDHGMTWRMVNDGLTNCGIYSLAVDRSNPDTVYAATPLGLHKSVDAAEHWQFVPHTGPKELRITAERAVSVRAIAVDPRNGDTVYAASPGGKIYKSVDGAQTWAVVWEKQAETGEAGAVFVQFGGVNAAYHAGAWLNLPFPEGAKPEEAVGIGFTVRGDKIKMEKGKESKYFVQIRTAAGVMYQSRDLAGIFQEDPWHDVVLKAEDFALDAAAAKKFPDAPKTPKWPEITRLDFCANGPMTPVAVARIKSVFFAFAGPDQDRPVTKTVRDFAVDKALPTYGNVRVTAASPAKTKTVYSVAVALTDPSLVAAATEESGVVLSEDAGKSWRELNTPKRATSVVFADGDPNLLYGCFGKDGVWKSTDKGRTWERRSEGIPDNVNLREVAVSPENPANVFVISGGPAFSSADGGKTWKKLAPFFVDLEGNPTRHYGGNNPTQNWGRSTNITINPRNAKEMYISSDWRSCWSGDGGVTWHERERGSDIVCNTDLRFHNGRVYTSGMDVGALVSEDNGKSWRMLWPDRWSREESGGCWRIAVDTINGADRIVTAFTPWDNTPKQNVVILSEDGGKTHKIVKAGLPDYLPAKNTMWENGYMRALAADPNHPKILYAGIDGDAEPGRMGGGIFKSEDGGHNWKPLPSQPGSRRMFNGLAVDPTDSKRIFWGACGTNGGVWMTEDGGGSWKNVFSKETWIWDVQVTGDGYVYAGGNNLWRSRDHGGTWTQLTPFQGRKIQAFAVDPRDSKRFWVSALSGDRLKGSGIYRTTDDGATWTDITGDHPNRQPQLLRFNPETQELWSGWVGLYKLKQ